jgi:hypothetical protein
VSQEEGFIQLEQEGPHQFAVAISARDIAVNTGNVLKIAQFHLLSEFCAVDQ